MAHPATCHLIDGTVYLIDPQKRIIEGTEDYLTPPTIGAMKETGKRAKREWKVYI